MVSRNLARRSGTVPLGSQRESRGEDGVSPSRYLSCLARRPPATIERADEWSPLVCNPGSPGEGSRYLEEMECLFRIRLTVPVYGGNCLHAPEDFPNPVMTIVLATRGSDTTSR